MWSKPRANDMLLETRRKEVKFTKEFSMSNRKDIKTFKAVNNPLAPCTRWVSTDPDERHLLYDRFRSDGIELPCYSSINRAMMKKEDLRVLCEDWELVFDYKGKACSLVLKKGYIWDGASIPAVLVIGRLTKNGKHIQVPAMVHDILFNQHLLGYDDCNNVFRGLLNREEHANTTKRRYTFGVRSPVGKSSYKKNNPAISWMKDFYEWSEI